MQTGVTTSLAGVVFGYLLFDERLSLWVWAARPLLGKTTFAWQLCQHVAGLNGVPAVFVSLG